MNREQIAKFLECLGEKPAPTYRDGWVVARCPLGPWRHKHGIDKNPSFGIRVEPGDGFCHCWSCGYHGSQSDLLLELRLLNRTSPAGSFDLKAALHLIAEAEENMEFVIDHPDIEEVLFGEKEEAHVFPEWWLDSFVPVSMIGGPAVPYLQSRGVPMAVAVALDLRYDSKQRRVCFPVRDFEGRLRGLHGRAIEDDVEPRYRMYTHQNRNNPEVWLGESWVDLGKPVVMVESVFDLARVCQVYRNVVCPLTASLNQQKLKRVEGILEWVTLLDRDHAGDMARARIDKAFKDHVVTHLSVPDGYKDPGEMPVEEVAHLLGQHVPLDDAF